MPTAVPTLRRVFDKVSQAGDEIDHAKVSKYLQNIGVGSGLLGGQKVKRGADAFIAKFDANKDGQVSWSEFVANGQNLVPPGLADAKGRLNPALVGHVFDQVAGAGAKKATKDDVAAFIKPKITGVAALFADSIAEATGRIAADALDADGDGSFTREDLAAMVADINANTQA